MAKPEWGVKRTCQSCGVRFYDLRRSPIACPACKAVFTPDLPARQRRAAPMPQAAPAPVAVDLGPEIPEEVEDEEVEEVKEKGEDKEEVQAAGPEGAKAAKKDGQKSDELIEDTSELGEDEDDVSEVKEHIDEGEKERL